MSTQLALRCVLALMAAMTAALAAGLLAWGPIGPGSHQYADSRLLAGVPGAANALAALPLVLVGAFGVTVLRRSPWPKEVARPWRLFFGMSAAASLLAAGYHIAPGDGVYVLVQMLLAAAFTALLAGFLAERVHPQFGSRSACAIGLLLPLLAALWSMVADAASGAPDLRGSLLLQLVPVLLVPAGALCLPGRVTTAGDWLFMLALYASAKLLEAGDADIYAVTGWISGHSLMHLALAGGALWLVYRAGSDAAADNDEGVPVAGELSQRMTSSSTSA